MNEPTDMDDTANKTTADNSDKKDFMDLLQDITPECKSDEDNSHLKKVKSFIASKQDFTIPLAICTKESLESDVFWDITVEVCQQLSQKLFEDNEPLFDAFDKCLKYLVTEGNQKEVFIILIDHIISATEQLPYSVFVEYAGDVVKKMSPKQINLSCDTLLNAASRFIETLERPQPNLNLEGDERKLIALDPMIQKIADALNVFLNAMSIFTKGPDIAQNVIDVINRHIFVILDQLALVHYGRMDPTNKQEVSGYCSDSVKQLLGILAGICPDFYKLLCGWITENERINFANKLHLGDNTEEREKLIPISDTAIGCLIYSVVHELFYIDHWPSVLSHVHVFRISIQYIIALLKRTEDLILYKGISLAETIIGKFPHNSLCATLLDDKRFTNLVSVFVSVMLYCKVVEYRQRCLKLLEDYIKRFNAYGRYKLYNHIIQSETHAGVVGHIIGLIKQEINNEIDDHVTSDYFSNESLEKLLVPALDLNDGLTTDLLTESDRIIAGLNLIRYLAIRDSPDSDKTGFWKRVDKIETLFLEPLKKCIAHSRANYKTELQQTLENKRLNRYDKTEMEVKVGNMVVPPMLQGRHLDIIHGAMRTFDLIESLHGRVSELIGAKK